MKITYSLKTKKFTVSNLSFDDMVEMHSELQGRQFKEKIRQALLESLDSEEIEREFGYSAEEYLNHLIQ